MATKYKRTIYEMCAVCGEPIYIEDERYELCDGDVIHVECLEEWAQKYHSYGEADLGYDN